MTGFLLVLLGVGFGFFLLRYYVPLRRLRQRLGAINQGAERTLSGLGGGAVIEAIAGNMTELLARNARDAEQAESDGFNLRAILGSMREGVVLLDEQKRIRLANEEIHRLLPVGLSPINRTLLELFRNHRLHRAIEASFVSPGPQMAEFSLETVEQGRLVTKAFEVTSMAMNGRRGEVVGALAVFHEVTRLKALEAVRREFVANVSHELRTPLSIISGYIETMLDENLEDVEAGRKYLRVMNRHTERLHLLVEDLLTVSTLESQKATLSFASVDLPASLSHVVEQLELALRAKKLTVNFSFPMDFPKIEVDAHRMEQVFTNLLDNAVKHGRTGDRPLEISGRIAGEMAEVTVRDHGPGIPLRDQPHIFERFYRVDEARSRENGGTGLGLSIVKHVVQAHGGTVAVTSALGAGATFRVELPLRQRPDNGLNPAV